VDVEGAPAFGEPLFDRFGGRGRCGPADRQVSAPCLHLAPEGVHAGAPLVRDLLEGLMGLLLHHLEAGAGDQFGDGATELRATGAVAPAGEDERRRRNLRQAVGRVVVEEGVEEGLQVLGPGLVGKGE
jgi:hypothetical protein